MTQHRDADDLVGIRLDDAEVEFAAVFEDERVDVLREVLRLKERAEQPPGDVGAGFGRAIQREMSGW